MEQLSPPRKPEDIQADYFRLCAEVGEREFRITMMRDEITARYSKMQDLSAEMDATQKAIQEANEGPKS